MNILNYSKSTERELKTYGMIINVITLGLFRKWVNKNLFDYKKNTILKNILHQRGTGNYFYQGGNDYNPYKLSRITEMSIESGWNDVDRSIRIINNWDSKLEIGINIVSQDFIVIYQDKTPVLSFNKDDSKLTGDVFRLLWAYYTNLKIKTQEKKNINDLEKLKQKINVEMEKLKNPEPKWTYILTK